MNVPDLELQDTMQNLFKIRDAAWTRTDCKLWQRGFSQYLCRFPLGRPKDEATRKRIIGIRESSHGTVLAKRLVSRGSVRQELSSCLFMKCPEPNAISY